MVLQNPVMRFPVLLFPVLHFQRSRRVTIALVDRRLRANLQGQLVWS